MPLAPEPGPERIYEGPRRYAETTTAGVDRTMASILSRLTLLARPSGEFDVDVRDTYFAFRTAAGLVGLLLPFLLIGWGAILGVKMGGNGLAERFLLAGAHSARRGGRAIAELVRRIADRRRGVSHHLQGIRGLGELVAQLRRLGCYCRCSEPNALAAIDRAKPRAICARSSGSVASALQRSDHILRTRHAPYDSRPASKGTLGPHLQGLCYCHDRRASRGHGASRKQSSDDLRRVGRVWVFSAYWFAKTYELSRVSRVEPQSGPEPHAKRIGGELKIGPLDFPGAPM
jgi:hypothetical protein